jgi:hypothetical protein
MKRTHAQFKLALCYCKNNEEMLRNNLLATNFLADKSKFWKNVKNASNYRVTNNTNTVKGVSGDNAVAEMWKNSFEKTLWHAG